MNLEHALFANFNGKHVDGEIGRIKKNICHKLFLRNKIHSF